ncbi:helix-turn-helix domain-containing protein [Photobacterium damselae]|uniref:helix-turn-helix domain-containing protein n=1 Tax=Photobacterium damselae TaxID=38293 RepID=UPI0027A50A61
MQSERIPFGKYIKQARTEANINQSELARQLNIARQTYLDIESGKTTPRADVLWKISILTEKPITYFFGIPSTLSPHIDELTQLIKHIPEPYQTRLTKILQDYVQLYRMQ